PMTPAPIAAAPIAFPASPAQALAPAPEFAATIPRGPSTSDSTGSLALTTGMRIGPRRSVVAIAVAASLLLLIGIAVALLRSSSPDHAAASIVPVQTASEPPRAGRVLVEHEGSARPEPPRAETAEPSEPSEPSAPDLGAPQTSSPSAAP